MLKHVLLALLLLIGLVCASEVGLRAHHLRQRLDGSLTPSKEALIRPCPLAYQHLPFSFTTTQWSSELRATVEISTNSLGLRGSEVAIPKPPNLYRIVCIGDDATFAPDVAQEQTFCSLLVDLLQPEFEPTVEVINAGQPGHCPLLSLAWARGQLLGLQPDLVVLCCDVSDVADDRCYRPWAKFDERGFLISVANPASLDRPRDWLSAIEDEFLLARFAGGYFKGRLLRRDAPAPEPEFLSPDHETHDPAEGARTAAIEQCWEPLTHLQMLCNQISTEFVVAVVPSSQTIRGAAALEHAGAPNRIGEMFRLLLDRTNRERIPLLDPSPEFARHPESARLCASGTGALSKDGHRLFAEILAQALLARRHDQSRPKAVPVAAESTAPTTPPPTTAPTDPPQAGNAPLPTLERRPRPRPLPGAGGQ